MRVAIRISSSSGAEAMLQDPKVIERLKSLGYKPEFLAGNDFKAHIAKEYEVWKDVAKSANIVLT